MKMKKIEMYFKDSGESRQKMRNWMLRAWKKEANGKKERRKHRGAEMTARSETREANGWWERCRRLQAAAAKIEEEPKWEKKERN